MWNLMALTIQIELDIMLLQKWTKPILLHVIVSRQRCHYKIAILRKLDWRWVSRPARVRNKDRSDFDKYCPQKVRQYWNIYIFHVWFSNWIPSQNLVSRTKNSLDKELTWKMLLHFLPSSFWRFLCPKNKNSCQHSHFV